MSGPERFFMQSIAHFSLWLEMQQDPNCSCHTLRGNLLGVFKGCFEDLTAFEEMSSPVKSPRVVNRNPTMRKIREALG